MQAKWVNQNELSAARQAIINLELLLKKTKENELHTSHLLNLSMALPKANIFTIQNDIAWLADNEQQEPDKYKVRAYQTRVEGYQLIADVKGTIGVDTNLLQLAANRLEIYATIINSKFTPIEVMQKIVERGCDFLLSPLAKPSCPIAPFYKNFVTDDFAQKITPQGSSDGVLNSVPAVENSSEKALYPNFVEALTKKPKGLNSLVTDQETIIAKQLKEIRKRFQQSAAPGEYQDYLLRTDILLLNALLSKEPLNIHEFNLALKRDRNFLMLSKFANNRSPEKLSALKINDEEKKLLSKLSKDIITDCQIDGSIVSALQQTIPAGSEDSIIEQLLVAAGDKTTQKEKLVDPDNKTIYMPEAVRSYFNKISELASNPVDPKIPEVISSIVTSLNMQLKNLEKQLKQKKKLSIAEYEEKLNTVRKFVTNFTPAYSFAVNNIKLTQDLETFKTNADSLQKRATNLQQSLSDLKQENQEMSGLLTRTKELLDLTKEELEKRTAEFTAEAQAHQKVDTQLKSATVSLSAKEKIITEMGQNISRLENNIVQNNTTIAAKEAEIEQIQLQLVENKKELEASKQKISTSEAENAQLKKQISALVEKNNKAAGEIAEKTLEIAKLGADVKEAKGQQVALEKALKEKGTEVAQLSQQITALTEQVNQKNVELAAKHQEIIHHKQRADEANEAKAAAEKGAAATVAQLTQQVNAHQGITSTVDQQRVTAQNNARELGQKNVQLQQQVQQLQQQGQQTSTELEKLRAENTRLNVLLRQQAVPGAIPLPLQSAGFQAQSPEKKAGIPWRKIGKYAFYGLMITVGLGLLAFGGLALGGLPLLAGVAALVAYGAIGTGGFLALGGGGLAIAEAKEGKSESNIAPALAAGSPQPSLQGTNALQVLQSLGGPSRAVVTGDVQQPLVVPQPNKGQASAVAQSVAAQLVQAGFSPMPGTGMNP